MKNIKKDLWLMAHAAGFQDFEISAFKYLLTRFAEAVRADERAKAEAQRAVEKPPVGEQSDGAV